MMLALNGAADAIGGYTEVHFGLDVSTIGRHAPYALNYNHVRD